MVSEPKIIKSSGDAQKVKEERRNIMKTIIKDVLSCKSLRDGVKQALTAILIAVLERVIVALKGGERDASGVGMQQG